MYTLSQLAIQFNVTFKKTEHISDVDTRIRECYLQSLSLINRIKDVMLFKRYEPALTPYYYNLCAIIGFNNDVILSKIELFDLITEFVNDDINYVDSEIYLAFYKAFKKYLKIKRPKASPYGFIVRHMILNFRDVLRSYYSSKKKRQIFVELDFEPSYVETYEFNVIKMLIDAHWLGDEFLIVPLKAIDKFNLIMNKL